MGTVPALFQDTGSDQHQLDSLNSTKNTQQSFPFARGFARYKAPSGASFLLMLQSSQSVAWGQNSGRNHCRSMKTLSIPPGSHGKILGEAKGSRVRERTFPTMLSAGIFQIRHCHRTRNLPSPLRSNMPGLSVAGPHLCMPPCSAPDSPMSEKECFWQSPARR